MRSVCGIVAAVLLAGGVAAASAQSIETGTVVRIDPQSSVVVLEDGRMYRVTPSTVLVVDNRPAPITAVRPGQRVVIQSGEVVMLRDGQYVTVSPPAAVVAQPAAVAAVPAGVRQTVHGRIADVDSNGEVEIRTDRDTFEVKVAPEVLRHIKKGDNVTIDLTITQPGAPSALPR
ncbi:MAG TPA: hypothetical protein VFV05_21480 [Methylomirabilota bacterium]|nr:hypothetical protein [Methylomirabilota bacterium]